MAKGKYAPGELERVRDKLGVSDRDEANKLAQIIGGEVGYERTAEEERALREAKQGKKDNENRRSRSGRSVELPVEADNELEGITGKKSARQKGIKVTDPGDDPIVPLRSNYWDRIKLDRFAAQPEFEIKSPGQVFSSVIAFFSDANDFVNPIFITRRLPEYYKKLEGLVIPTRTLLPRNNILRSERMKKSAPVAYSIVDAIRYWDIERISSDLTKIQAHPKNVRVVDFADIMRAFYKPLFILNKLDYETHIRGAYKILYKLLYIENPIDAKEKYQENIRTAVGAYSGIKREIQYLLYPLLMKLVSANYIPYELFFEQRKNRIMVFLNVDESSQINPETLALQGDAKNAKPGDESSQNEASAESSEQPEKPPETEEEKAERSIEENEKKALERSLQALEALFPRAGWEKLSTYPDLYPYFQDVLSLRKGVVNIAPTDPLLQIYILMRILEEFFFGLRYVNFGIVRNASGKVDNIGPILSEIINEWQYYIEESFEKGYLPRMAEYVRILEGSVEERNSPYTKKIVSEMHWIKRLYLLPFYDFEYRFAPPIQKSEVTQVYVKIKMLRKYLAAVAANIEQGKKAGGAEAKAFCDAIDNPWAPYSFQVPNPVSKRLDALLKPKNRNNASLVYFCLAVAIVLDHLVNNEDSWAYSDSRPIHLFRSVKGEGITPYGGVDHLIDADEIFRQALKQRQKTENTGGE
jgi:hypothetical protein